MAFGSTSWAPASVRPLERPWPRRSYGVEAVEMRTGLEESMGPGGWSTSSAAC